MQKSSKLGHIMYNQITNEYTKEIEHVKHVSQKLYMYNTSFNKICISTWYKHMDQNMNKKDRHVNPFENMNKVFQKYVHS